MQTSTLRQRDFQMGAAFQQRLGRDERSVEFGRLR